MTFAFLTGSPIHAVDNRKRAVGTPPPTTSRPSALPALSTGVVYRGWYDFTDSTSLTVTGGRISRATNKSTAAGKFPDMLPKVANHPQLVPNVKGALSAAYFIPGLVASDREILMTAEPTYKSTDKVRTLLVLTTRKGLPSLPDAQDTDTSRLTDVLASYGNTCRLSVRHDTGEHVLNVTAPDNANVFFAAGKGSAEQPRTMWAMRRWIQSGALAYDEQAAQSVRMWWSADKANPITKGVGITEEGATTAEDWVAIGNDWYTQAYGNPAREYIHEVIYIEGPLTAADRTALWDWCEKRLGGTNMLKEPTSKILGTSGNDNITGTAGDDVIDALAGDDIVNGMAGNDTITGGPGYDQVTGGGGANVFVFNYGDGGPPPNHDAITDFVVGTDRLQFPAGAPLQIEDNVNGMFIHYGADVNNNDWVQLKGVQGATLDQLTNPSSAPAPTPPPPVGGAPTIFEDFNGPGTGAFPHVWSKGGQADIDNHVSVSGGMLHIAGTSYTGVMIAPDEGNKAHGLGYGKFEAYAKMAGGKGSGSGPALVVWPGSNWWPGPELDFGEINANGSFYVATHWRHYDPANHEATKGGYQRADGSWEGLNYAEYIEDPVDWSGWHKYSVTWLADRIEYRVDDRLIGTHYDPAPAGAPYVDNIQQYDAATGTGENRVFGVMNGSWESEIWVDWMSYTPLANLTGGTGTKELTILNSPGTYSASPAIYPMQFRVKGHTSVQTVVFSVNHVGYGDWITHDGLTDGDHTRNIEMYATGDYVQLRPFNDQAGRVYSNPATFSSGGSTSPGTVGPVGFILQGQSNAFLVHNDAAGILYDDFKALTGLTDEELKFRSQPSHLIVAGDWNTEEGTLLSGTGTYGIPPYADGNDWLISNDGAATTWGERKFAAFRRHLDKIKADLPSGRPWLLVRMHSEYDQGLSATEVTRYQEVNREFIRRWREIMGRTPDLSPIFYLHTPYANGGDGTGAIINNWAIDVGTPAMNAHWAIGTESIATSRDDTGDGVVDNWHISTVTAQRYARDMARALAKHCHDKGWSRNDLSLVPRHGPKVVSCVRISGVANQFDAIVEHDKGDDLIIPADLPADTYTGWNVNDNGINRWVTGVNRINATTLRFTLDSNLSTATNKVFDMPWGPWYRGFNQITDNWGTKAKPAMVPLASHYNMPLAATRTGVSVP